ncbi:uncharacterized protein [Paralichthys olivaceus]|uniref:uncharacterized protein isoform X2 n=1 Tax=Paralichthys olivaceus TaxID=8255 RepID=UPI00097DE089|nr:PREDICTED: uncharacterized protein LOC109629941 [Paralichthys olivaceus]
MAPSWIVGLVWLMCSSITPCESAKEAEDFPHKSCNQRQSCMGIMYDIREAVCCKDNLHPGQGLSCCGQQPFNPALATCCQVESGSTFAANVTLGLSETVSACCGLEAYNPINHLCCQSAIVTKPVPMAQCCGKGGFDQEKQLCCGPPHDKKVLTRMSNNHQCCHHKQYDLITQCCCEMDGTLHIQPIQSKCCMKDSAQALLGEGKLMSAPKAQCCDKAASESDKCLCCGAINNKTILIRKSSHHQCCGHEQYDTETECCHWTGEDPKILPISSIDCGKKSGVRLQTPIPQSNCNEPHTRLCGSSCYNPNVLQCCEIKHTSHCNSGGCDTTPTVYDPRSQVCCDGCLSKKEPLKYQFHGSPGQHCCGTETYQPHNEICCNGHRYPKGEHSHCCGIHVYNINDMHMKCCAGTLYDLASLGKYEQDVQCCGSILLKPENQDVCCSSVDKKVPYSMERGFRCCGHLYYNTSLWSCCDEKLSPLRHPGQAKMNDESRYLSENNLNSKDLCKQMNFGTVESVSLHSVVFRSVLKIHPMNGTVKALASPYILKTPDRCSKPKLIPGMTYYFNEVHVFTGFTHDPIQSLYFIIYKCQNLNTFCHCCFSAEEHTSPI